MITTFVFDLSEVLLTGMKGIEEVIALNVAYSPAEVRQQIKGSEQKSFFHGHISEEAYWTALINRYGWSVTPGWLKRAVRMNFQEIDGTRAIIHELRARGYRLGLLSVHAQEWIDFCEERFTYHHLFDVRSYSYDVRVSKPEAEAYQHVLRALNSTPAQSVFIDDMAVNVDAAEALGLTGIQFTTAEQLRQHIAANGWLEKHR